VRGKLQKDGATLNVLAEEVRALKAGRSGGQAVARREDRDEPPTPSAGSFSSPDRGSRAPNRPTTHPAAARSPYTFLKTMRRVAPDAKSWG
jgi:hypothetical protein